VEEIRYGRGNRYVLTNEKGCIKCGEIKPRSEFSLCRRNGEYGLQSECKTCQAAYRKAHPRHNNPERQPVYNRKYLYDLTEEDFNSILENQCNLCALCKTSLDNCKIHVDHCHDSGIIRGLLCSTCNTGLGYYEYWARLGIFEDAIQSYLARSVFEIEDKYTRKLKIRQALTKAEVHAP